MESGAGVAGNVFDPAAAAAAAAKHIKYEDGVGLEPRPRALFRGLRGSRKERGERRETAAPPPAVTDHHPPREIKEEAPWGDGEVQVEVRVGQAKGRRDTPDEARGTSNNNNNKRVLANRTALVDGQTAGGVELQTGGKAALADGVGTGEVGRRGRGAVVDGAGAGGFPLVEAKLEELRANAVVRVTRDAGLQADGESSRTKKKPAKKKARLKTMTLAEVEAKRAEDITARSREEGGRKARIAAYREQERLASRRRARKGASAEKMSLTDLRACRKVLRKAAAEDSTQVWKELKAAHRQAVRRTRDRRRENEERRIVDARARANSAARERENERLRIAAARAHADKAARERERLRRVAKKAVAARALAREAGRERNMLRDMARRAAASEVARERERRKGVARREAERIAEARGDADVEAAREDTLRERPRLQEAARCQRRRDEEEEEEEAGVAREKDDALDAVDPPGLPPVDESAWAMSEVQVKFKGITHTPRTAAQIASAIYSRSRGPAEGCRLKGQG